MIQGKLLSYGNDLTDVYYIRKKVFIEELGISEELEFDELDQEAIHVLVYEEGIIGELGQYGNSSNNKTAVATGRIIYDGDSCRIENIAVLKEFRNNKYGDFTVKMLLNRAFTAGIEKVFTEVGAEAIAFFETIGFHVINNEEKQTDYNTIKMVIGINEINTCCKK